MFFTQLLIYTYVNSSEIIIDNLDLIDFHNNPLLCDNMTDPPLFEDQTTSQCNCTLITVVTLQILCYV